MRTATKRQSVILHLALLLCAAPCTQGQENLYKITPNTTRGHCEYHGFDIPVGKYAELANIQGSGKVTFFYITDGSERGNCFWPGLVLQVFWDDNDYPSINVPIADFFGAINNQPIDYDSSVMSVNHLCYMCYLPMPFSRGARFVLFNDGDKDYKGSIAYNIDYELGDGFKSERSRLHCYWNRSNPTNGLHQILKVNGNGHYVGNFLHVRSNIKGWWGEGDTCFEVDGQGVVHSPGTEDEYGACWSFGEKTFSYQHCGYIQCAPGKQHRMYRWYVANPIRFHQSILVDVQNQNNLPGEKVKSKYASWGQTPANDDYISVSYYYLDGAQKVELQPFSKRTAESNAIQYKE